MLIQTILLLQYKKKNDPQIFNSSVQLIAIDSDIDETFTSMYKSIMTKNENSASEDWIIIEIIVKHSIKIFEY